MDDVTVTVVDVASRGDVAVAEVITPRQRQIVQMLADGLSYKEIAAEIGVSFHTVKHHVRELLHRLSPVRCSSTQAVARALRMGLIR